MSPSFTRFLKYVPECIDCKHFIPPINTTNIYVVGKCKKILYKSVENKGEYQAEFAYIARSDNRICGPHGKSFEAKRV